MKMSQQVISIVTKYKGSVNTYMNEDLKKSLDHLSKRQPKAKQLIEKFNQSYHTLEKAIAYSHYDKQRLLQIQQLMKKIYYQFNSRMDDYIYHLQLVRQDYYQQLKSMIYSDYKYRDRNSYVGEFLKYYDQFDTKMYDISDPYIDKQLNSLTTRVFNKFKDQLHTRDDEFEDTLKKVLLQTFKYKLISYLQDGKPKDVTNLLEDYDQLIPLIDEYNQKHKSQKSLLEAELRYFNNILQDNNMNPVDMNVDNMNQEDVINMVQQLKQ